MKTEANATTPVERLLPQERFDTLDEDATESDPAKAVRVINTVIGKECAGMGDRRNIGTDTLLRLLNGQGEPDPGFRAEGGARIKWALSAMGPGSYARLHNEAGITLATLARKKREVEAGIESPDSANAWLNAALRNAEQAKATKERDERLAALIHAAAHGRLTVLVGAGVSKAEPANVPLYRELASEFGATEEEAKEPGKFFDEMKIREGYDLHCKLAEELRHFTTPSKIHEQLVTLMQEAGAKHLVTTNWDELLEASAQERGVPLEVWDQERREPGDGRTAEGIVHLHGTVRAPESMVVTEQEMKEHYEEGRTPDEVGFLTEILGGRTVLCVGYSHDDVMVAEIQRKVAERERTRRGKRPEEQGEPRTTYSMVRQEGSKEEWAGKLQKMAALGIEPIVYRDHEEVPQLLDTVISCVRRDAAWERDRLNALGERGAIPGTDWSEIEEILTQGGARLRHFLHEASPRKWQCEEFLEAGGSKPFTEDTETETGRELSGWLCREVDGERLKAILWMAGKTGGRLGKPLWRALCWELGRGGDELGAGEREAAALLLIGQAGGFMDLHPMSMVMRQTCRRCNREGRYEPALQAWRLLTRAKAIAGTGLEVAGNDSVAETGKIIPSLALETWETWEFWEKAVKPILEEVHAKVWNIGFETMEAYQAIADSMCARGEGRNGWAYTRKAIEPHEQDRATQQGAEGAVTDAMRDALDILEQEGSARREEWERRVAESARAASPLLRRVAAYGVERTKHWDDDRKLLWAMQEGRLDDPWMQHETFSLCAAAWRGAGTAAKKTFAEKVQGMRRHNDEVSEWARYRLIGYMGRRAGEIRELETQRKALQDRHPEWTLPQHPDLGSWSTNRWFGPKSPAGWIPENLLREWDSRGESVLEEIIEEWEAPTEARSPEEWLSRPNEEGRSKAIEDTIDERTTFGIELARVLHAKGKWDHPGWSAICSALGAKTVEQLVRVEVELGANFWPKVMEGKQGRCVGELAAKTAEMANAQKWALAVTTELQERFVAWTPMLVKHDREPRGDDWVLWSISTPGGKGVEAILLMTRNSEEAASANRKALEGLAELAGSCREAARHIRILTANHARWLLHIDEKWTKKNVIRRVEEVGEHAPERGEIWNGLAYAQWDKGLFEAMERALKREIRFAKAPNDGGSGLGGAREDTAAKNLAMGLSVSLLTGDGTYDGEQLDGIGPRRRTRMIRAICNSFRHEKDFRDCEGWKKVIDPMWDEIVEKRGGTTDEEQEALLWCFAYLSGKDQEKFRERFAEGAAVAPERFLDIYDGNQEIENRTAAIEVARHCARDFARHEQWKWSETLETLREWKKNPKAPEEIRWIERVLARAGEQG